MRVKIITYLFFLLSVHMELAAQTMVLPAGQWISLDAPDAGAVRIEVTAAPKSNRERQGFGKAEWGIGWKDKNGGVGYLAVNWGNTDFGEITDSRFLRLSIWSEGVMLVSRDLTRGVDLHKGGNTLKIRADDNGEMSWSIGSRSVADAGSLSLSSKPDMSSFFVFCNGSDFQLSRISVTPLRDTSVDNAVSTGNKENFIPPAQSTDSPEGLWIFLDRETDAKWARPGGQYRLGITKSDTPGKWDIIYLDGATANASRWKRGMKKGSLQSTPFTRHYDLEWIDSTFEKLDKTDECWASLSDDGTILTLNFPLDHSIMRFYRPGDENTFPNR